MSAFGFDPASNVAVTLLVSACALFAVWLPFQRALRRQQQPVFSVQDEEPGGWSFVHKGFRWFHSDEAQCR